MACEHVVTIITTIVTIGARRMKGTLPYFISARSTVFDSTKSAHQIQRLKFGTLAVQCAMRVTAALAWALAVLHTAP